MAKEIDKKQLNDSIEKLKRIGIPNVDKMPPETVVATAKALVDADRKAQEAVEKERETARLYKKAFSETAKTKLPSIGKKLNPLVKTGIENMPSMNFSKSYKLDGGTLTLVLGAFQDVEKPEIKAIKEAKEAVEVELDALAESFGIGKLSTVMNIEKGTAKAKSFSVLPSKRGEKLSDFEKHPIHVDDIGYNLSVKWNDLEPSDND